MRPERKYTVVLTRMAQSFRGSSHSISVYFRMRGQMYSLSTEEV